MYTIELTSTARCEYRRLGERIRVEYYLRLQQHLKALATNPHPPGARKLKSKRSLFRIRIGNYRIIYEVREKEQIALIAHLLRRNESTYNF
jgi:mRNA interferase RelE/StbE